MTYKSIIKNIISLRASRYVEDLYKEKTGISTFLWDEEITTSQDIDYGISFDVVGMINNHDISANGFIDNYGHVSVCTIWSNHTLIWSAVRSPEKWDLIK